MHQTGPPNGRLIRCTKQCLKLYDAAQWTVQPHVLVVCRQKRCNGLYFYRRKLSERVWQHIVVA